MAETKKRIIQYNEELTPALDDYLLLDSPTAGTRKILASNIGGGGGGGLDYSTTEQDTGLKWIDGRKIYQKTYSQVLNSRLASGDIWYTMNDLADKCVLNSIATYIGGESNLYTISNFIGLNCREYTGLAELMIPTSLGLSAGGTLTATIWYVKPSEAV